jgi:hypothetical protein
MGTAAPPLRRETGERLVAELIHRACLMNADDKWACRVGMLVLFGSYARRVERPNDVDIACVLHPRWSGEKQRRKEQERRGAREEGFRNISEWAMWPKLEAIRYLRARARGLSIHELEHGLRPNVSGRRVERRQWSGVRCAVCSVH